MKEFEYIIKYKKLNRSYKNLISPSYLDNVIRSLKEYRLDVNLDDPIIDVDYEDHHYNSVSYKKIVNTFHYIKPVNINSQDLNLFEKEKDNITYHVYGNDTLARLYVIYNKHTIIDYWEPIKDDDVFLEYLKDKNSFRKKYKPSIPNYIKELYI
jgi:hypothetical protein